MRKAGVPKYDSRVITENKHMLHLFVMYFFHAANMHVDKTFRLPIILFFYILY
jgi:hypothetical protein